MSNKTLYPFLNDLIGWGYIEKIEKYYQITDKLLYELGGISFENYLKDVEIENVRDSINDRLRSFFEIHPYFTNTQKMELNKDLKKTSNAYITLEHFFITNVGEIEGRKLFNKFMKLNKMTITDENR